MNPLDALEASYATARPVVAAVTPSDLTKPTPCEEWNVEALVTHFVNGIAMFPALLAGEKPDIGSGLSGDIATAFDGAVRGNLAAWREPGAAEKETNLLPGMRLIDINLCDAIAHTWDIATAIGVNAVFDPDAVAYAYDRWSKAPLDVSREYKAFGPEVVVAGDAPALDRFLGLIGRQPR
jgi:uncharacterized protein (TIGR03086 family)